ncbi:prephenate dehydrogenase [Multifurca ochricompacta]|uniref:Prephenate dehydrogenase [NADP(+)] n=1 Tax=Multifurca ochricompacta TaxID=376703 RepID=A0AAD4QMX0_9AGAM|nr:prephenate dehydrogenase [Multifurca ochricompacta]
MIRPHVTPETPIDEQPTIGLIGMGAMGKMYAEYLSAAGWKKINVCDLPERFDSLKAAYKDVTGITVLRDGHHVSRTSDFIVYSVEAEFIDRVVAEYGPSTKVGAIVAGQTSVKAPERAAFEQHLPEDVHIVSCHSLHGPTVPAKGQPLVLIKHRAPDEALILVENILRSLQSRYVYMSYEEHDEVTANTQAVTHAAFLSMGTAWASAASYPWEHGYYVGGIETVKVNIMLRIFSNKWHVYAGLAILNPSARTQIKQYAQSTTDIFKLMLAADEKGLRKRMYEARDAVFGDAKSSIRRPILLSENVLDQFGLGKKETHASGNRPLANSHLSLLAMVDCWARLGLNPFKHLELAATPIFRMWFGVAEYLFRSEARLDAAIQAALYDVSHRYDDVEFVVASRGWSQCVSFGSFELYQSRFQETAAFFESRFEEAGRVGSEMLKVIMDSS